MTEEEPLLKAGDVVNTPWGPCAVEQVEWRNRYGSQEWLYRIQGTWFPGRVIVRWEVERLERAERRSRQREGR